MSDETLTIYQCGPSSQTSEMADGIDRLAWRALQTASAQFGRLDVGEYTVEDIRGWGSTILIAYQKRGLTDTPDVLTLIDPKTAKVTFEDWMSFLSKGGWE